MTFFCRNYAAHTLGKLHKREALGISGNRPTAVSGRLESLVGWAKARSSRAVLTRA